MALADDNNGTPASTHNNSPAGLGLDYGAFSSPPFRRLLLLHPPAARLLLLPAAALLPQMMGFFGARSCGARRLVCFPAPAAPFPQPHAASSAPVAGRLIIADIFLMTAVVEERLSGYSAADAVDVGLQRSGPIISWVRHPIQDASGPAVPSLIYRPPLAREPMPPGFLHGASVPPFLLMLTTRLVP